MTMDLSKAFDSLPHKLLIRKLQAYGLDNLSCSFLLDYLQNRLQQVTVEDTVSSLEFTSREVPQGCVLYNVFLNDLA